MNSSDMNKRSSTEHKEQNRAFSTQLIKGLNSISCIAAARIKVIAGLPVIGRF